MKQTTNAILMVRPIRFRMNEQTAVNNYFQKESDLQADELNQKAQEEFDLFVNALESVGVDVTVLQDTPEPSTPDSVFPNNWISFHQDGTLAVYPMFAENRRAERREDVLTLLEEKGFQIHSVVDYTEAEEEGVFLEGTGSVILDRVHKKAYCALSERADESLFIEFCEDFDYYPVVFQANQTVNGDRLPIYHTNVMMALGETLAVICLDTIDDKKERKTVQRILKETGKKIITISEKQMHQFAGNMLQVRGTNNKLYMVMSQAAYDSLNESQLTQITSECEILSVSLDTIELLGGGSARCMMAEVFLPK